MSKTTLPELAGFELCHGIPVCLLGEDGIDYVALGHHEPKAALAAFNHYAQRIQGLVDLTDGAARHDLARWRRLLLKVTCCWAVLKEHCDDYGHPDHRSDCWHCREIEEAGWWIEWSVDPDTSGAFPVTAVSV